MGALCLLTSEDSPGASRALMCLIALPQMKAHTVYLPLSEKHNAPNDRGTLKTTGETETSRQ